jgi:hypothetical protein
MTTIDDLRRSFEDCALDASDGAGMAERVHAGARRIRRRRRIAAAGAAACLVTAVAAIVPAAVAGLHADGTAPAATRYRGPGQLTVRPAADSTYLWQRGTDGTLQWMSPHRTGKSGDTCCAGVVRVHDPGTYDSTALEAGERITVGGRPAFWAVTRIPNPRAPGATRPGTPAQAPAVEAATVGWRDPSGAWVTVVDGDAGTRLRRFHLTPAEMRTHLLDVAADVRLGAPQDVLVPMHFPAIPGNLPITFAEVDEIDRSGPQMATLGFGGDDTPTVDLQHRSYFPVDVDAPLEIAAWTANGMAPWVEIADGPVNTTVAGRPARYHEKSHSGNVLPGGSTMLVEVGSCGIVIKVRDRTVITRADLEAMFAGATFDDCDSPRTWTRPVR